MPETPAPVKQRQFYFWRRLQNLRFVQAKDSGFGQPRWLAALAVAEQRKTANERQ